MRYDLLRLFLIRTKAPPLLEIMEPRLPAPSRREYLKEIFGAERRFIHRKVEFVYRPFGVLEERFVAGVIAKEGTEVIGLPPEGQFQPQEVTDWKTANLFLDIDDNEDGQKVALQSAVGTPLSLIRSFVDSINESVPEPQWEISANPITAQSEFWSVVDNSRGSISVLELTFTPPNIWGGQSETEKALKQLSGEDNATEVEIKIKNDKKRLNPKSDRVKEAVDYITRGGGELKLKSGQDTLYDSESKASSVDVEDDPPVQTLDQPSMIKTLRSIFK